MKSLLSFLFVNLASLGIAFAQTPTILTFDDLSTVTPYTDQEAPIPNGYGGLQWTSSFYVMDSGDAGQIAQNTGYLNGLVSGKNIAFDAFGDPVGISVPSGSFDLNSTYLTAAFLNGLQVEVQGLVGGTLKYDNVYTVNVTSPTLIDFNYLGIDQANFISLNPLFYGRYFVLDNLSVTVVPEPGTAALLLSGVVVLSSGLLRRTSGNISCILWWLIGKSRM